MFVTFRIPVEQIANITNDMTITVAKRTFKCIKAANTANGSVFHASMKEANVKKAMTTIRAIKREINVQAVLN